MKRGSRNNWIVGLLIGLMVLALSKASAEIPPLKPADLSNNLLKNGSLTGLKGWQKQHISKVNDYTDLKSYPNMAVWERSRSRGDGGLLGIYQELEADVSGAKKLELCLDVWVGYHTLPNTGWWSEQNNGSGEMPVHITVAYEDKKGQSHNWDHGFMLKNTGGTTLKNVTIVPQAVWTHHCFNLMSDSVRKDPKHQKVLPKPVKITRVSLYGNGWDFHGGVGNVLLSAGEVAPGLQSETGEGGANLIKNGKFQGMSHWEKQHISNTKDSISIHPDNKGFVIWERRNSHNDGGLLGVYQDLEAEVKGERTLELCLEVIVSSHSLPNTGWWSEQNNGSGEMPVHITVSYEDKMGKSYNWDYGFLISNSGGTTLKNFALVDRDAKKQFCFDLMKDSVRKDPRGQKTLPPPAKLTRVAFYGNGWDFKGGVGNISLIKGQTETRR